MSHLYPRRLRMALRHRIGSLACFLVFSAGLACAQQAPGPAFDADHAFDAGSRITLTTLTPAQADNLVILGKVWGFLKYHHPVVTSGRLQWDYQLLRVLPRVLAAPDRAAGNAVLQAWVEALGEVPPCTACASLAPAGLHLRPALAWLDDASLLGPGLGGALRRIYARRPVAGTQFYISLHEPVGNPVFGRELAYPDIALPDAGFQLLALFRFWNIVAYWAPYREAADEPWDDVLREALPRVALAPDRAGFELAMMAAIARLQDTHANLWSALRVRPPVGDCHVPAKLRFVEQRAVVTGPAAGEAAAAGGLQAGDVIEQIDGVPVARLVDAWRPYYAASNEPARLRDIAGRLTGGACGAATLRLHRGDDVRDVAVTRVPRQRQAAAETHDREGETLQWLAEDIAYLKLSSLRRADVAAHMAAVERSRGLVIDLRNYPREFVVFALGAYLVGQPGEFARFTKSDLANPGAFHWTPAATLRPQGRRYGGKVMVLVDEISQSQAEYTAMALRVGPRVTVIGSTTAGADGNISPVSLPGGLSTVISGIGVFYPDGRPTQRVGIVPDITVLPSIAGVRAGRDEVLDAAIAEIRRP